MSAANIVVRPDAAYLFADTAWYLDDGSVMHIGSKIGWSDRHCMGVSVAGFAVVGIDFSAQISAFLDGFDHADAALNALPGFIADALLDLDKGIQDGLYEPLGDLPRIMELYIARWSHERDRAEGFIVGNEGCTFQDYEPLTIRRVSRLLSPPVGAGFEFPEPFDGPRDGLDLLQRQRHVPDDRGIFRVGGGVEMARVTAKGVERRTLHAWRRDRIGRPIRPRKKWWRSFK